MTKDKEVPLEELFCTNCYELPKYIHGLPVLTGWEEYSYGIFCDNCIKSLEELEPNGSAEESALAILLKVMDSDITQEEIEVIKQDMAELEQTKGNFVVRSMPEKEPFYVDYETAEMEFILKLPKEQYTKLKTNIKHLIRVLAKTPNIKVMIEPRVNGLYPYLLEDAVTGAILSHEKLVAWCTENDLPIFKVYYYGKWNEEAINITHDNNALAYEDSVS